MSCLDTPRLRLRPLTRDDLDFLAELHGHPEVARYLADGRPRSREVTATWLERALEAYAQGLGHLAIERRMDGALLGRAGLWRFLVEPAGDPPRAWWSHDLEALSSAGVPAPAADADLEPVIEVGYAVHRPHWGCGYATEAALALRDDAFRRLDPPSVSSFIFPANTGSIRVARKNGMRAAGEVLFGAQRVVRYRIERADWTPAT